MGMLKEYKEFISKGNVIDLAVGVVIGGAFGKIVSSLVNDIVMPPIGYLLKGINFKDLKLVLTKAGTDAAGVAIPEVAITYGNFIQTAIEFLIIAWVIFLVVRTINKMKKAEEVAPAPAEPSSQEKLLMEIRDSLKK
ncbi:MAG: large-conductance mechanosensitive channel protein MscL [Chitinophagales bacterium]|nr:large-conductance mechanosensitive channel protein MscL [Chitinophagales bacterium]